MTIARNKQERRRKKPGAWLGTEVDMLRRKQIATKWMDMTFHDSFLAQSSHVRIIWPRRNNLASRVERKCSGGSAKDVNNVVTQANSRSGDFIL